MDKQTLGAAIILAFTATGISTSANATLASNAVLNFTGSTCSGTTCIYDSFSGSITNGPISGGSYFAMDLNGTNTFTPYERIEITPAGSGLTLGTAQAPGQIDNWIYFGANGQHYTTQGLTVVSASGNTAVIDMNGWTVAWGGYSYDMGQGADPTIICGVDCGAGDSFSMTYLARVPSGGFYNVLYQLHLEGVIANPVPVPAAIWLFGSGFIGLAGIAARRKAF
jgi:hypothetical protein